MPTYSKQNIPEKNVFIEVSGLKEIAGSGSRGQKKEGGGDIKEEVLVNCQANKNIECLRHKILLLKKASELLKSRLAQTGNKNGDQQKNRKSDGD
jgi:hypothetical protein